MLFWVPWHIMSTYFQPFAGGGMVISWDTFGLPLKLKHVEALTALKLEHVKQLKLEHVILRATQASY